MVRSRVILAVILSFSLPQTSLSRASSSSLGAIVYADRAHLGAGNASAGTTIFPGDKLRTEPAGSLQIRAGAARLLLSGSSSTTLTLENDRLGASLTTGSAVFSTANSRAFTFHVGAAVIRPSTDLPTIGQVMVLNPKEFLVKSIRASLRIAVEDDLREIPEGAAYRIMLDPPPRNQVHKDRAAQAPRATATYRSPTSSRPNSSGYPSHSPSLSPFGPSAKLSKAPTVPNSISPHLPSCGKE